MALPDPVLAGNRVELSWRLTRPANSSASVAGTSATVSVLTSGGEVADIESPTVTPEAGGTPSYVDVTCAYTIPDDAERGWFIFEVDTDDTLIGADAIYQFVHARNTVA